MAQTYETNQIPLLQLLQRPIGDPYEINHTENLRYDSAFLSDELGDAASRHSKMTEQKVFLFSYLLGDCLGLGFIPPAQSATTKIPGARRNKEPELAPYDPTRLGSIPNPITFFHQQVEFLCLFHLC